MILRLEMADIRNLDLIDASPEAAFVGAPVSPLLERPTSNERAPGGGWLQENAGNPKSIRLHDEKSRRTAQEGENPAQNGEREQRGV